MIAVVLLLFRDHIFKYGDETRNLEEAGSGFRPLARVVHPFIHAIGIPPVILGGVYQLSAIHRIRLSFGSTTFQSTLSKLDLEGLDKGLATLLGNIKTIDDKLGALSYPEFLVMDFGTAKVCQCPVDYSPVKDNGKWDLNSWAGGDKIETVRDTQVAD